MSNDYQKDVNEMCDHAEVVVLVRPPLPGEVPILTVIAPLCITSSVALSLGGVREMARLAKVEPALRLALCGVLEALPDEFDRECGQSS